MTARRANITTDSLGSVIRRLAQQAVTKLDPVSVAHREARLAMRRPMNYMRCAELPACASQIHLAPGMSVLDVSSPQWLTLALAADNPGVQFTYINIIDIELDAFAEIARACGLSNVRYLKADVRELEMADQSFDVVVSVSVIEHVYPEQGGDLRALAEMKRVLKPQGRMAITVPFKQKANVVYTDGAVYERESSERNFYAREYDDATFKALLKESGLYTDAVCFICERPGIGAIDFWEWGPGKGTGAAKATLLAKRLFERLSRTSLDDRLAKSHLVVTRGVTHRSINIVASLALHPPQTMD